MAQTRTGNFFTGKALLSVTCLFSKTTSLLALERQVRINPAAFSAALRALSE